MRAFLWDFKWMGADLQDVTEQELMFMFSTRHM